MSDFIKGLKLSEGFYNEVVAGVLRELIVVARPHRRFAPTGHVLVHRLAAGIQLGTQFLAVGATAAWSVIGTLVVVVIIGA